MPPHVVSTPNTANLLTAKQARAIAEDDQKTLQNILFQIEESARGHGKKLILHHHINEWIKGELERLGYDVQYWFTIGHTPPKAYDFKTHISWENAK